ncbi:MAG: hypothetical protein KKD92_06400 [Proteobacteria bacterium]|nr:hypothetical protein [Pseudomonadota bacterium]
MPQHKQPLAEVFGHLIDDQSLQAVRYRSRRLCPFNNKIPNCTKDKAKHPLGVCSIFHDSAPAITCPIRFREDWLITDDAASFFFGDSTAWSSLTEVRLNDANGKSAGNIDVVLVAYDDNGKVLDFGALEIQAVYISGNVRDPFEYYMKDPKAHARMDWSDQPNYPRPDFLSSSRKRLAPQLLFKGGILHSWQKKSAVALNKSFFDTLPHLPTVRKEEADIAWLIYDLKSPTNTNVRYELFRERIVYTKRQDAPPEMDLEDGETVEDFLYRIETELENVVV